MMRELRGGSARSLRRGGFTVMEVMVAIFLFALILMMIYSTWRLIFQSSQAAIRSTTDSQRARMAMRTVEDALASATMFASNPRLYFFQADTAGQFAAVSFAADLSDSFPNSGMFGGERIRRVSFYVPPGGNDLVLEQNSLLADFESGGEPASIVLAREVQLFQLEFWDGQQRDFVEEWLSTNQLPVIVRVTLGFGVSKGSREPAQIVSRVVRLPTVAVPREAQGVIGGAP
jgi:prepilin-type N-terminal cleavage/methylation domain-containing protein